MGKYSKEPFTFVRQERNKTEDEEEYNGNKYHIRTDNIYRTCTDSISCSCRIKRDSEAGRFEELKESEKWKIKHGKRYYVTRNNSSIIAVKAGKELDNYSFHVTASHSDSPAFKLKENAEIEVAKKYTVLNTEGYGGMICQTWFDRPLSLAGRVMVKNGERIETRLVKVDRDLLMIPRSCNSYGPESE